MRDSARFHFGFTVPLRVHASRRRDDRGRRRLGAGGRRRRPRHDCVRSAAGGRSDGGSISPTRTRPRSSRRLPFVERPDHPAGMPVFIISNPLAEAAARDVVLFAARWLGAGPDDSTLRASGCECLARAATTERRLAAGFGARRAERRGSRAPPCRAASRGSGATPNASPCTKQSIKRRNRRRQADRTEEDLAVCQHQRQRDRIALCAVRGGGAGLPSSAPRMAFAWAAATGTPRRASRGPAPFGGHVEPADGTVRVIERQGAADLEVEVAGLPLELVDGDRAGFLPPVLGRRADIVSRIAGVGVMSPPIGNGRDRSSAAAPAARGRSSRRR